MNGLLRRVGTAACAVVGAAVLGAAGLPGDPAWGVLGSTCAADRVVAERSAGLTITMLEARWDLFMPAAGTVDASYVAGLKQRISTCAGAGLRVVLGSGTQYVPAWVRTLSGASLKDQYGNPPTNGQIDTVFSAAVSSAEADYLRRLVAALPPYTVEGIRVGNGTAGEIGFPGGYDSGRGPLNSWWAFGAAPQNGTGLATGQQRTPMPGWIPGATTWQGKTVSAAAALNWFLWYERSLMRSIVFQTQTLRAAGFLGYVHVPAAGSGVLPADLAAATTNRLGGAGNRDGSLYRGLYYVDQFPVLAGALPALVVDLTSIDDATAVAARALNPPQDACTVTDAVTSVDTATPVATWSNMRFARAQAARAGLPVVGENVGPPSPQTGGVPGSDPETQQVARAPGYARGCAMAALFFAFEDDLFTGRSGITLQNYVQAIG